MGTHTWPGHDHDDGPLDVGPPRIRFGLTEILHLLGAVVVLTFAVSLAREFIPGPPRPLPERLLPDPIILLGSALAVGSGFTLHELAHKIVAQRYGHWAEFRAQFGSLLLSYILCAATGFLFAAPGAVLIQGRVTPRESGLISLVGPGVNFVLAAILWPFTFVASGPAGQVLGIVVYANALLGLFNLLPVGPLDGRKVLRWSGWVYALSVLASLALFVAILATSGGIPGF
ncbi:MAG: site-2 protease family protein [Candidatus Thermoplasmatota archaeon]